MARKTPPSFDFFPDDFSGSTDDMTPCEVGMFIRLLIYQFRRGFVPDDLERIWMILRVRTPTEEDKKSLAFVLSEKFEKTRGNFVNFRMKNEREKAHKRHKANIRNGKKGGRPKGLGASESENPSVSFGLTQTKPNGKLEDGSLNKEKEAPTFCDFPPEIDTPEIRELWGEWQAHRQDMKHPLTERAAKMAVSQMAAWGPDAAAAAIRHSIANGYRGLFQPPANQQTKNGRAKTAAQIVEELYRDD